MKKVLYIIAAVFIFVSCEKDVDIDLPQPDAKLVVEGYIENDAYPIVVLTRNSSYFDPVDSTTLANLFVTNATVVIYDGFEYDTLQPVININNINMIRSRLWNYYYLYHRHSISFKDTPDIFRAQFRSSYIAEPYNVAFRLFYDKVVKFFWSSHQPERPDGKLGGCSFNGT